MRVVAVMVKNQSTTSPGCCCSGGEESVYNFSSVLLQWW